MSLWKSLCVSNPSPSCFTFSHFFSLRSRGQEHCLLSLQPISASFLSSKIAQSYYQQCSFPTFLTLKQTLSKMSFLSRKPGKGAGMSLVQGGAVRRLRLCLCQTHHTGEKLALRLPRCAPLGKSQLLFGPQCPHLRNKRGWPYACSPLQIPPLSQWSTLMLGLALPPYPCQKEEKKLALVVRGGRAARGCQAALVVAG